jgi:hypothetical protein
LPTGLHAASAEKIPLSDRRGVQKSGPATIHRHLERMTARLTQCTEADDAIDARGRTRAEHADIVAAVTTRDAAHAKSRLILVAVVRRL